MQFNYLLTQINLLCSQLELKRRDFPIFPIQSLWVERILIPGQLLRIQGPDFSYVVMDSTSQILNILASLFWHSLFDQITYMHL